MAISPPPAPPSGRVATNVHRPTANASVIPMESVHILDVPVSRIGQAEVLALLTEFIRSGEPHMVVTADASAAVIAASDAEFRAVVNGADLVTPDSAGMLWAARRLGRPLPERVSGVDLAERLCELAARHGWGIFFFGAAPGVADVAAARMQARYPGMRIAGTAHGFLSDAEQGELEDRIRQARPEVLLVAMGIPRQEKWIWRRKAALGVPLAMGVGGSFDVFAGNVARAPAWMQRRGLEWLYRLAMNPRKISKVATLPRFVWMVLRRGSSG